MSPGGVIVLAAAAHIAPQHVAGALRQSQAAWEYVAQGVEAALLWLLLGAMSKHIVWQAVAAWGAMEGAQRAACRLAFPMDTKPPAMPPGQNLCDAATGYPMTLVSLIFAAAVVLLLDCTRSK